MNTSKKNSFFPIGPVSSALMRSTAAAATGDKPGPPAKGAFSSEGDNDKQKEVARCKSQQQESLSGVVEDFFWIGSSIVAFSKWRLGYMGKLCQIRWVELDGLGIRESSHRDEMLHFFVVYFVVFLLFCVETGLQWRLSLDWLCLWSETLFICLQGDLIFVVY